MPEYPRMAEQEPHPEVERGGGNVMCRFGGRAQSGEVAYSPEASKEIADRLWNQCKCCLRIFVML